MKNVFTFLTLAFFMVVGQTAYAVNSGVTNAETTVTSMNEALAMNSADMTKKERRALRKANKEQGVLAKMYQNLKKFAEESDKTVVAALLCFFLGGIAIHRVYLGGKKSLILLYFITVGGIFGILPLLDLIKILIDGPEYYEGNDDFTAGFKNW